MRVGRHHATLGNGVVEIIAAEAARGSVVWMAAGGLTIAWLGVLAYRRCARAKIAGGVVGTQVAGRDAIVAIALEWSWAGRTAWNETAVATNQVR